MRRMIPHVMFAYWGRRGLSRLVLDVARAASTAGGFAASVSVSRQNENFAAFESFGPALVPVDTFSTNAGAILQAWRIPIIRKRLGRHIAENNVDVVIDLMPHVWSSFIAPTIKAAGARYAAVIHDAVPHPGDYRTASVDRFLKRTFTQADVVLTLARTVADQIGAGGWMPRRSIFALFHPDIDFGARHELAPPQPGEPLRLLFLGRILAYKGLPTFLDMVDVLRSQGVAVQVGVFGEGALGENSRRLSAVGAEVVNRWLTDAEIKQTLARFHAVVLSHMEASQSGVAAAALGAGLPVIAMPVGGIVEQVDDGVTGVIAAQATVAALAEATKRLLFDPELYNAIRHNIVTLRGDRSAARFVEACVGSSLDVRRFGGAQTGAPTGRSAAP